MRKHALVAFEDAPSGPVRTPCLAQASAETRRPPPLTRLERLDDVLLGDVVLERDLPEEETAPAPPPAWPGLPLHRQRIEEDETV